MAANKYDSYLEFPSMFTAELFEPDKWAKLFADAGAKYVSNVHIAFLYHIFILRTSATPISR